MHRKMLSPFASRHLWWRILLQRGSSWGRVAEVFDPLGLASPFIVRAKIFVQDLWTMGLRWDEPITQELSIRAKEWFLELEGLKERFQRA